MKTGYGTALGAGKRPASAKGRQMWGTNAPMRENRAQHSQGIELNRNSN
jgi:hypothetical protein